MCNRKKWFINNNIWPRHQSSGAVIGRCGQPEVSWWGWRNADDEHLVQSIAKACAADLLTGKSQVNGSCVHHSEGKWCHSGVWGWFSLSSIIPFTLFLCFRSSHSQWKHTECHAPSEALNNGRAVIRRRGSQSGERRRLWMSRYWCCLLKADLLSSVNVEMNVKVSSVMCL